MYENKKFFILGMARSGYEVAKLLASMNNEILITDIKEQDAKHVQELIDLGVNYVITNEPENLLDSSYDYMIKNPGIHLDHKCVIKAKELNIPIINEVELAYHLLPKDINIIGVTGSNGKTTTVTLIYEILKKANLNVHLGGNIGFPLSSLVKEIKQNDILLMEISDHQLLDMYDFKTNISVLTNISPTHLDLHGTYEHYKYTKKRIFNNHTNNDIAILNFDNNDVLEITKDIPSKIEYFSSTEKKDAYIDDGTIYYSNEAVINIKDIKIKGSHNYENIMAAIMVVKKFNVSNDIIKEVLGTFNGVEHRIEFVRTLNGVDYYNDSKSTNPKSTITALSSFENPTILILGGYDRKEDLSVLSKYIKNVKYIVGYGQTKEKVKLFAENNNIPCSIVDTIKEVVPICYKEAKENDVVLLSPACASWDQYDHFEERGDEYKELVNKLGDENICQK
mgnify:CR=1 FL=1